LLTTLVGYTQQVGATTPETYTEAVDRFEMAQAVSILPAEHQKTLRTTIGAAGEAPLLPEQMDALRQWMGRYEAEGMLTPESVTQAFKTQQSSPEAEATQTSTAETILAMAALGKALAMVDTVLDAQIRANLEQAAQQPTAQQPPAQQSTPAHPPQTTVATQDAVHEQERVAEAPTVLSQQT
jgi:hypothetical protein